MLRVDHANGFAIMTRRLAYRMADHITEKNPTNNRKLHLDGNVVGKSGPQGPPFKCPNTDKAIKIGSVNGARGSLRSKLLRGLFEPVSGFLGQIRDCKEESLFAYNMGLSKTGI
jgi:hypothetical protein